MFCGERSRNVDDMTRVIINNCKRYVLSILNWCNFIENHNFKGSNIGTWINYSFTEYNLYVDYLLTTRDRIFKPTDRLRKEKIVNVCCGMTGRKKVNRTLFLKISGLAFSATFAHNVETGRLYEYIGWNPRSWHAGASDALHK